MLDRAQGTPSASCHPAARSSTLRLSSHQNPVLYVFIPKEGSGNDPLTVLAGSGSAAVPWATPCPGCWRVREDLQGVQLELDQVWSLSPSCWR